MSAETRSETRLASIVCVVISVYIVIQDESRFKSEAPHEYGLEYW